jgi:hypothetical protein
MHLILVHRTAARISLTNVSHSEGIKPPLTPLLVTRFAFTAVPPILSGNAPSVSTASNGASAVDEPGVHVGGSAYAVVKASDVTVTIN